MTPSLRLRVAVIMIMLSAIYAVIVAQDYELATTIATGYIAILLTAFVFSNIRKKP